MEDPKALNRRFLDEIMNRGNVDAVDDLVSEDIVEHIPLPGQPPGRDGVKQAIRMLRAAFPDMRFDVHAELAEGDLVAAVTTFTATHQGEFLGLPATGKRISVFGIDVTRARDGKFVEHWGLIDTSALLQQLGMAPEGPPGG